MQAKRAGTHGNPESGNHRNPSLKRVLGRMEGPRTGRTWDLRHPKKRWSTCPSTSQSYSSKWPHKGASSIWYERAGESTWVVKPRSARAFTYVLGRSKGLKARPRGPSDTPYIRVTQWRHSKATAWRNDATGKHPGDVTTAQESMRVMQRRHMQASAW